MKNVHRVRQVANALNFSTASGLLLAALSKTKIESGPHGLILGLDYQPRLPLAGAFTVGNVIFYRADREFVDSRPELLAHEAAHSTQYALCLGLPFLPLYFAAAAWSWWRTGDPGSRNIFERGAGLTRGGYREMETLARLASTRNFFRRASLIKSTAPHSQQSGEVSS